MDEEKKKKGIGRGNSPNSIKNLRPISKGEIRNPQGGRAHDPIKKELKKFTSQYLTEIIEMAVMGNLAGLKTIVENPNSPAIQVGVAKALFNAISSGDWGTLESIVSRVVGKTPDNLNVNALMKNITIEFVE